MPDNILRTRMVDAYGVNTVGLDEVGRGSWAGPVAIGAVILPSFENPPTGVTEMLAVLNDSKKLSPKKRERICTQIQELSVAWAVGMATSVEVDTLGLSKALTMATERALDTIATELPIDSIILDGNVNYLKTTKYSHIPTHVEEKLDASCDVVAAASIVAKVIRDSHMDELAEKYPGYGWEKNKGYFAPKHHEGLITLGATDEHRTSWAWVSKYPNITYTVREN